MATRNAFRISDHSCQKANFPRPINDKQIPVKTLSRARPNIPKANHQLAPLRGFRKTAATARAALNTAAIKANVDSDVTADDLRDRAMKSFPTHPIREYRQFYPKICQWSRGDECHCSRGDSITGCYAEYHNAQ